MPSPYNLDFVSDISLDNWLDFPYSAHTFQNVSELIPVKNINGPGTTIFNRKLFLEILRDEYQIFDKNMVGNKILEATFTDAFMVCRNGEIISEFYANQMQSRSLHLAFSISKSITAIIAGILFKKYGIDLESKVSKYIDCPDGGAYKDATIRNLLDMTVSLEFDEIYSSKEGVYARYRQAMLWMPRTNQGRFCNEDLGNSA